MSNIRSILKKYAKLEMLPPRDRPEEPEYPFEGKIVFDGIVIDIENAKGSTRSGVDPDGVEWSVKMKYHYGEIRNSLGADGDKLDVYVGPYDKSKWVFIVHQVHPPTHDKYGEFDEDKVMLGFKTANDAISAYQSQYNRNDFFGSMSMIPLSTFKEWIAHENTGGLPVQPPVQWKHDYMGPDEAPRTASIYAAMSPERKV